MQAAEPLAEDWGNHNIVHLHPAAWARAVLCIGGEGILPCVLYQAVHPWKEVQQDLHHLHSGTACVF